jgi:hypothetical protein
MGAIMQQFIEDSQGKRIAVLLPIDHYNKMLEHKRLIRIVKEPDINSFSLPGAPVSEEDFIKWVEYAEASLTVNLTEAKQRWDTQKKKLQKLIR